MLVAVAALIVASSWVPLAAPRPVAAADPPTPRFLGPKAVGPTQPGGGTITAVGVPKAGFQDSIAIGGLTAPTAVRFSSDGRVFVIEKGGRIRVFPSLTSTTPTDFTGLQTNVDDFWDRGLMGLALDPAFPANPYVYVLYTYDAAIGDTAPRWNDACPTPPGPTSDGCVVSGRLSRFTVSGTSTFGSEQVLLDGWCQQYPSHSMDDLRFGSDGALYVSAGDGASFTFQDYGQGGGGSAITPRNPCGDPPGGSGGQMTSPTARGGRLRAQSLRRPAGEPVVLNGTVLRVDPATGTALPSNPLAAQADPNAQRIVGYGMRNPFRFTIRPGTNEVWIGDGGDLLWEEINRIADPLAPTVANFGWPCYEGAGQHAQYKSQNLDMCNSLYAAPVGLQAPYYTYNHDAKIVAGESCSTGSSVISGISFYDGSSYPSAYHDALFFADHSRNCIWAMKAGANGLPDPNQIETFLTAAANPVAIEAGPGGDLFYVDHEGGAIHRISYIAGNQAPSAVIVATPATGRAPLQVTFDGTGSTDPEGLGLSYAWDLDGDGTFTDSVSPTTTFTYTTEGTYTVGLRVTDSQNVSTTATTTIIVGASLPDPVIDSPISTLNWAVGDLVDFAGHATDSTGAALPDSALTWTLVLHHCPSNCHTHTIQSWSAVAAGSFNAPDHDYPSYLELVLTATDDQGRSASTSVRLDPRTVVLTLATSPPGLAIAAGVDPPVAAPFTKSFIVNSTVSLAAPSPQVVGAATYTFDSWSDGGLASHTVVAPATAATYTATFASSGPTTAYLSDLAYTVTANGFGPAEKDRSNGEAAAGDGRPLTLASIVYPKGIGVHAASDIRLPLSACSTFTVKVGLDDEVGANGSLSFQIWGDTTKLADSGIMTGASPTQTLTVDLTGRSQLRLVVDPNGVTYYDHADWADAQLTCGSGPPPPPDTTPPTITGLAPADGATGVATTVSPTVTFSEPIDPATISGATFSLVAAGTTTPLAAAVTYDATSRTATLDPSATLADATTYTATVLGGPTGVEDLAGIPLAADRSWSFTTAVATGGGPTTAYLSDLAYTVTANGFGPAEKDRSNGEAAAGDGRPLTLASIVYPKGIGAHAASDIRLPLSACSTFTVKVGLDDEVGANGSLSFQIWGDTTKLADSGIMTGASPTQTLTVDLTGRSQLRLVVDPNGVTYYDHADWADAQLTCGSGPPPPPDTTPPTITGLAPADGATGVATTVSPTVTFSEPIDPATISGATFSLVAAGTTTPLAAAVTYDATSRTATLDPSATLADATTYTATVLGGPTGVEDLAGIPLAADRSWSFTTAVATGGGPTTAYLSDLAYTVTANGFGPAEKDRSNGEAAAGDGRPLTLASIVYPKGIGAHAASDIGYPLAGACNTFTVKVGLDDEVGANGSLSFQIWGDTTKLADSGIMTGASSTQTLTVDLTGRSQLRLVVDPNGVTYYDHADWADAQLTCGSG